MAYQGTRSSIATTTNSRHQASRIRTQKGFVRDDACVAKSYVTLHEANEDSDPTVQMQRSVDKIQIVTLTPTSSQSHVQVQVLVCVARLGKVWALTFT
jgi:hypothetical protein